MQSLIEVALSNAVVVAVLGILVVIVGRFCRRPAVMHCLWMILLVKLVSPPLFSLPVDVTLPSLDDVGVGITLSSPESSREDDGALVSDTSSTSVLVATRDEQPIHMRPDRAGEVGIANESLDNSKDARPASVVNGDAVVTSSRASVSSPVTTPAIWLTAPVVLASIWAVGAVVCLLVSLLRIVKFRSVLKLTTPASSDLIERVQQIARRMGLKRAPDVLVVPGAVSPMLWGFGFKTRLLVPSELLNEISEDAVDTLLVHELAHFRRGDHRVRLLELLVCCIYWWHPIVWWAIKQMRNAEEQCCDAWVVSQLPEHRGTYARALVQTVRFVSSQPKRLPVVAGALGQGLYHSIEQRVRAIMTTSPSFGTAISPVLRFTVLLFAIGVLPWLPTFAEDNAEKSKQTSTASTAKKDAQASDSDKAKPGAKSAAKKQNVAGGVNEPTSFSGSVATLQQVAGIAISSDSRYVVAGHGGYAGQGAVSLWDLKDHSLIRTRAVPRGVMRVAFSPDGKLIAYTSAENILTVVRTKTFEVVKRFEQLSNGASTPTFSSDGTRLAFAIGDMPTVVSTKTWESEKIMFEDVFSLMWLKFSPDGTRLLGSGGSFDNDAPFGRAMVWDAKTGRKICQRNHTHVIMRADWSPDGRSFATGSLNPRVQICNAATGAVRQQVLIPNTGLHGVAYSPDGSRIATIGAKSGVVVIDSQNAQRLMQVDKQVGRDRMLAGWYTPDGTTIVTGSSNRLIKLWDAKTFELKGQLPSNTAKDDTGEPVLAIACSPDKRWIAAGREDRTITIHDGSSGKTLDVLDGHDDVVAAVAFSKDGVLASAGYDQSIKLWNVKDGEEIRTLEGHTNWVFGLAFSKDGKTLASCGYDKTVRLWNVRDDKLIGTIEGHTAAVRAVAFSPDNKRLATASSDRTVRIWDARTRKEIKSLSGHKGTIRSVAFSPDGKTLASASEDSTVKLWDTTDWKEQRTLSGHQGMVWSVTFSNGGRNIATASYDQTVKIWDPKTGQARQTLQGHTDIVSCVAFAPDTSVLVSGSMDRSVRLWRATGGGSRKIAATGSQIYLVKRDGTDLRPLVTGTEYNNHGSPDWSNMGQLIAYDAWKGSPAEFRKAHVFVVRSDGTGLKDLGDGAIPQISPDGKRIVFCRYQPQGVWIMNSDGTEREMLEADGWGPTWSRDGKFLSYSVYNSDGGNIRVVNVETNEERLLFEGEHASKFGGIYWGMRWSPDGKRLCFRAELKDGSMQVSWVDVRGSSNGLKTIHQGRSNYQLGWTPDNKKIVMAMNLGEGTKLYGLSIDDPKQKPELIPGQPMDMNNRSCDISPDGEHLVVTSEPDDS